MACCLSLQLQDVKYSEHVICRVIASRSCLPPQSSDLSIMESSLLEVMNSLDPVRSKSSLKSNASPVCGPPTHFCFVFWMVMHRR